MAEEQDVTETPEEVVEAPEPENQEEAGEEGLSFEDRAEPMGWKPLDEFKGDKAYWVDAETFIKNGEESLPILRSNVKTLQRAVHTMQGDMDLQNRIHQQAMKIQRTGLERDFNEKMRSAAADGDSEAVMRISEEKTQELAKLDVPEPTTADSTFERAFGDFEERNDWYNNNQAATDFANAEGGRIRDRSPGLSPEAELKQVEAAVKENFPDIFRNAARKKPSAVAGGKRVAGKKKSDKTYDAMPAEFREMCDEMGRDGVSKADYVKNYWATEESAS